MANTNIFEKLKSDKGFWEGNSAEKTLRLEVIKPGFVKLPEADRLNVLTRLQQDYSRYREQTDFNAGRMVGNALEGLGQIPGMVANAAGKETQYMTSPEGILDTGLFALRAVTSRPDSLGGVLRGTLRENMGADLPISEVEKAGLGGVLNFGKMIGEGAGNLPRAFGINTPEVKLPNIPEELQEARVKRPVTSFIAENALFAAAPFGSLGTGVKGAAAATAANAAIGGLMTNGTLEQRGTGAIQAGALVPSTHVAVKGLGALRAVPDIPGVVGRFGERLRKPPEVIAEAQAPQTPIVDPAAQAAIMAKVQEAKALKVQSMGQQHTDFLNKLYETGANKESLHIAMADLRKIARGQHEMFKDSSIPADVLDMRRQSATKALDDHAAYVDKTKEYTRLFKQAEKSADKQRPQPTNQEALNLKGAAGGQAPAVPEGQQVTQAPKPIEPPPGREAKSQLTDLMKTITEKGTETGDSLANDFLEGAGFEIRKGKPLDDGTSTHIVNLGDGHGWAKFRGNETIGGFIERLKRDAKGGKTDPNQLIATQLENSGRAGRLIQESGVANTERVVGGEAGEYKYLGEQGNKQLVDYLNKLDEQGAFVDQKAQGRLTELEGAGSLKDLEAAYSEIFKDADMEIMDQSYFDGVNKAYKTAHKRLSQAPAIERVKPNEMRYRPRDPARLVPDAEGHTPKFRDKINAFYEAADLYKDSPSELLAHYRKGKTSKTGLTETELSAYEGHRVEVAKRLQELNGSPKSEAIAPDEFAAKFSEGLPKPQRDSLNAYVEAAKAGGVVEGNYYAEQVGSGESSSILKVHDRPIAFFERDGKPVVKVLNENGQVRERYIYKERNGSRVEGIKPSAKEHPAGDYNYEGKYKATNVHGDGTVTLKGDKGNIQVFDRAGKLIEQIFEGAEKTSDSLQALKDAGLNEMIDRVKSGESLTVAESKKLVTEATKAVQEIVDNFEKGREADLKKVRDVLTPEQQIEVLDNLDVEARRKISKDILGKEC